MLSVGEQLRQRREERGIGLEPVMRATKLPRSVLAALEEDRFDDLPGDVYARGFLKIYAQYLEMDAVDLLQGYEAQAARKNEFDLQDGAEPPGPAPLPSYLRDTQSKPTSLTPAGLLLFGATLAIALAFMWSVSHKTKAAPLLARPTLQAEQPATATGPAVAAPAPPSARGATGQGAGGKGLPPLPGRDLPRR